MKADEILKHIYNEQLAMGDQGDAEYIRMIAEYFNRSKCGCPKFKKGDLVTINFGIIQPENFLPHVQPFIVDGNTYIVARDSEYDKDLECIETMVEVPGVGEVGFGGREIILKENK